MLYVHLYYRIPLLFLSDRVCPFFLPFLCILACFRFILVGVASVCMKAARSMAVDHRCFARVRGSLRRSSNRCFVPRRVPFRCSLSNGKLHALLTSETCLSRMLGEWFSFGTLPFKSCFRMSLVLEASLLLPLISSLKLASPLLLLFASGDTGADRGASSIRSTGIARASRRILPSKQGTREILSQPR